MDELVQYLLIMDQKKMPVKKQGEYHNVSVSQCLGIIYMEVSLCFLRAMSKNLSEVISYFAAKVL